MADRNTEHPWGTCDACGVDLGGVCCYSPHSLGDYDTLCNKCFAEMKKARDDQRTIDCSGSQVGGKAKGVKKGGDR